ncbi:MAG: RluA family pseudouridine synthase [Clostridia bacterium]|jgi:23S rRNA pseudouridine1911/1915/1917 synthase|nr:RluA family pseudouridine synthase [Clostridia bacterium]
MKYHQFNITKHYSSIYYFLKDEKFSENYISNLRKEWGNISVNNQIVNIRKSLSPGDILKINSNPNKKTTIMQCILPLDIVYEDEYYLLINKPSGLSCMPNKRHYTKNLAGAICNYMQQKDENFVLRIINRLDKDTAGIIIVAKDSIAQNKIKDINKTYHAVCQGEINTPITINKPIKTICKNGINNQKRTTADDGQEATTFVIPIKSNNNFSLISLNLLHGRTHQIRVHLSSINHSLIGDELYGEKSNLINHTALICDKLSFFHPFKNQTIEFKLKFPEDFLKLLKTTDLLN